ncbi:hypothetical protein CFP56_041042 [Quercus suber]|uniref:Uncharacterized protein n=1 Tax=Quercus suber TaxID=58331 RepID=A0AAW0LKY8_QUESU
MSGAQGAQSPESKSATTYESISGERTKPRLKYIQKRIRDKVEDAAGKGGPVFGAGKDENKQDLVLLGHLRMRTSPS